MNLLAQNQGILIANEAARAQERDRQYYQIGEDLDQEEVPILREIMLLATSDCAGLSCSRFRVP